MFDSPSMMRMLGLAMVPVPGGPWAGRQGEGEGRSPTRLALDADPAAVGGDDLADDRQAQPGAAVPRAGDAVELLEDVRQVLGRDALAGVFDGQPHRSVVGPGGQADPTA